MEHNRKTKLITMVALIVAVLGLSVGLSAYSKTLNIQNVQASVAGNSSNFNVVFSTTSTSASDGSVKGTASGYPDNMPTLGAATLDGTTISNLTVNFTTDSRGSYTFFAYNKGSIPAYLTGITFGKKTCTGAPGTNSELVQAACDDISVGVYTKDDTGGTYEATNTNITNSNVLNPNSSHGIYVFIDFRKHHPVDGDFTATIDKITLTYSSQKPSA